jgi:hypothetical protein
MSDGSVVINVTGSQLKKVPITRRQMSGNSCVLAPPTTPCCGVGLGLQSMHALDTKSPLSGKTISSKGSLLRCTLILREAVDN